MMRGRERMQVMLLVLMGVTVAALTLAPLTNRVLSEETHRVKSKDYEVVKDDDIDYDDEEEVAPESVEKVGDTITIVSKTFKPPTDEWKFKPFDYGTHVDIETDPGSLSPSRDKDELTEIKISVAEVPETAGSWPLKGEGNLQPPSGGEGYTPHWSAKMAKEAKAYAANAWWVSYWGHATEMKGLIDNLGYITLKEEPPTKASAVAAAPPRRVWYSLSDGHAVNGRFECLCFGWTGNDLLSPEDLPADLHYTLVFANACKSASGRGLAFANAFGADAYVGWRETIGCGFAVSFAHPFLGALKGGQTVQQAVTAGINSFDKGSLGYRAVVDNIRILRGANVVVDLSSN